MVTDIKDTSAIVSINYKSLIVPCLKVYVNLTKHYCWRYAYVLNCRGYFVPNIVLKNFISFFLKLHPNKETFSLCVNEQTILPDFK